MGSNPTASSAGNSFVTILIFMDVKRRWKSLSFKVEHLRLELEEREEKIRELEIQFMEELASVEVEDLPGVESKPLVGPVEQNQPRVVAKNDNLERQSEQESEEVEPAQVATGPKEMKKLWKMIASISHPDKTNNDPLKTKLYKKAAAAWKSKSYDELYSVAFELGIDVPDASDDSVTILSGISSDLEKKLKESETSILWLWGSTSPENRLSILDLYLRSRGKKRKQNR